jgi:hypothetical protein|tara:strand:+ start:736 stop:978 length:243 start_codon:yes stop_codon:yes gene_type:complete
MAADFKIEIESLGHTHVQRSPDTMESVEWFSLKIGGKPVITDAGDGFCIHEIASILLNKLGHPMFPHYAECNCGEVKSDA